MPLSIELLQQRLEQAHQKFANPAIAVSVFNADQILFESAVGVRSFQSQEAVTLDDYFHIGSCAKSVLGVLALQAVEKKQLDWSTAFVEVFPELNSKTHTAYCKITLLDLLICRAGIPSFTQAEKEPLPYFDGSLSQRQTLFREYLIAQPPATKRSGEHFKFLYSNASYALAANMIERVSDKSYLELIDQLANEIGITIQTGWPNQIDHHQPWGHIQQKNELMAFEPNHQYQVPDLLLPAGDLAMSAKDFAKYTQYHLKQLIENDYQTATQGYPFLHYANRDFAIGSWNARIFGWQFSGFDGSAGTFYDRGLLIPKDNIGLSIVTNMGSPTAKSSMTEWLTKKILKHHFNKWWLFWL